jgi:leader peptidase (prepilin peptidase) / N-methyltransferase
MTNFPPTEGALFGSFWTALGLAFGSFANVCIHRIPQGKSIRTPRSACPQCRRKIPWRENIPLLSYVLLNGRCGGCRARISGRYPLVEAITGALFWITWRQDAGQPALLLLGGLLSVFLIVIAFIDLDHRIIPDGLSLGLLGVGVGASPLNSLLADGTLPRVAAALIGAATGFLITLLIALAGRAVWKKDALGGGDVKLMAAVGSFVGWAGVPAALFAGSFAGTLWVGALAIRRRFRRGDYVPFGPFLAAGAWLVWIRTPLLTDIFRLPLR